MEKLRKKIVSYIDCVNSLPNFPEKDSLLTFFDESLSCVYPQGIDVYSYHRCFEAMFLELCQLSSDSEAFLDKLGEDFDCLDVLTKSLFMKILFKEVRQEDVNSFLHLSFEIIDCFLKDTLISHHYN